MRILTDGAMDLFHPGHIRLLRRIKEQYPVARRRIETDTQGRKIRELAARPWLAQRLANEPALRAGLKRRGATEPRIAIFKNVFCQGQLREKCHEHRELAVGRAVLAHNLYVLARLQAAQERAAEKAAAKAQERKRRREAA